MNTFYYDPDRNTVVNHKPYQHKFYEPIKTELDYLTYLGLFLVRQKNDKPAYKIIKEIKEWEDKFLSINK